MTTAVMIISINTKAPAAAIHTTIMFMKIAKITYITMCMKILAVGIRMNINTRLAAGMNTRPRRTSIGKQ